MTAAPRHFLELSGIGAPALRGILDDAAALKRARGRASGRPPLAGRSLAMIFERPSTRTRVSFELAMKELGGDVVVMTSSEMQTGRGETVGDTARVLSRYVDAVMIRCTGDATLREFAAASGVPVINGLTDRSHPCQLMADVMTFEERRGGIRGRVVAWCGDGNNMARTWIEAAARFGFALRLACPAELAPPEDSVDWARGEGAAVEVTLDPRAAVDGADCVVTDTWVSMGQSGAEERRRALAPYRVDGALMAVAGPEAVFMHCLPAHRGMEVSADVLDGPRSAVWDEAENRLHAQKAILAWCLGRGAAAAGGG